ncbi:MAG: FAD-dependent oxidoreductase [Planctomycetota bacterium]|nr:FAD-dependent oxidoreductase [Planctomycetota bacterium]
MKPLRCDHLVVGAGSTGLAVADHLLRREAGSVILIDALDSPQAGPTGERIPLLAPQGDAWSPIVHRARELYEGWNDWIEVDPELRRCGALVPVPTTSSTMPSSTVLEAPDSSRRWSSLQEAGPRCHHQPEAATVDPVTVASALLWRIRKVGGHFLPRSVLTAMDEKTDGVDFCAGIRTGTAGRIYICTGIDSLRWLDRLRLRHRYQAETVSSFTVALDDELPPIIYWQEERAMLFERGDGYHEVLLISDSHGVDADPPSVDWDRYAAFRDVWRQWIPLLEDSQTLKAKASSQVSKIDHPEQLVSAGGRIIFPGACGEFSQLLFPALAEMSVEGQLAGDVGGLLEDPSR